MIKRQTLRRRAILCILIAALISPLASNHHTAQAEPPNQRFPVGWRGDGSGRFESAQPPTEWGGVDSRNIAWRADVGESFSSPIVVGHRIFVMAEPHWLVCVNRSNGKELWRKSNTADDLSRPDEFPSTLPKTSCGYTTPTPTSDGRHVYMMLGTGIAACYDLEGKRRWIRFIDEKPGDQYGQSSSPLLIGDKLILHLNSLIALDTATGKEAWRNRKAWPGYGSPIATRVGNVELVVTAKGDVFRATDGRMVMSEIATTDYSTPIAHDRTIYFLDAAASALRLPEELRETNEPDELWYELLDGEFYASPVYHNGLIYAVNRTAHLSALDAAMGKAVWDKQLTLPVARELPPEGEARDNRRVLPSVFPSVTLAGEHLYVSNDTGHTVVLACGREYRKVASNSLDQGSPAAIVAADSQLFVRSGKQLLCIQTR